jgi:methionyl-tRNA synthetase
VTQAFFITTPIYYVNASPHLGHAYTTILADCMNRFHKLLDEKTFFLTGTDEHGDKIVQAAEENGQSPREYVDRISRQFRELWPHLGIEHDAFVRTTDRAHQECVQQILQLVYDNGDIYFGEYGGHYCFGCERFYTDKELVEGLCPDHLKKPTYIREKNYFFRMSRYQDWLREKIEADPGFIQPRQYRNEVLAMLRDPLDDLCISRPKTRLTWGIALPFDPDYVTYVWFDALINYISALGWPDGENFRTFWPGAHHLVAKDILKPHAIFWPTMLKAAGLEPYQGLRVHGYWKVEEAKMSKSLGNVVDPLSMCQKHGLDGFRYFLMREMQFGHDGSFSEQALVNRFNADLANDLGNLFNRSLSMTHKYFQGQVPQPLEMGELEAQIRDLGLTSVQGYVEHGRKFQMALGLESLWEFVRGLNKYIDTAAPWVLNKEGQRERLQTVMATVLAGLRKVALAVWPVMPEASTTMLKQLGLSLEPEKEDLDQEARDWVFLEPGTSVAKTSNLFPRKDQPDLEPPREASEKELKAKNEDHHRMIEFGDFQKMELKVGTVVRAEAVKKADKLLRLEVDLGESEPRQVVAGLAEHYGPDQLPGTQVIMVANLKPRKLMGILSQGMVLAVHDASGLKLVTPSQEVQPGSRVS